MRALLISFLAGTAASVTAEPAQEELNLWPIYVRWTAAGQPSAQWSGVGPFLYSQPLPTTAGSAAVSARGFRPLFSTSSPDGKTREAHVLYPLFSYRELVDGHRWTVLSLINRYQTRASEQSHTHAGFDLWPFYFSRETGSPETSYRAVLPLHGSVPNRFGQDRVSWTLFPLYVKWERNNVTTTTAPWPFLKVLRGEGNRGFELWPLFGMRGKEGAYREGFFLWPFLYKRESELWKPQPSIRRGFLPFYSEARSDEFMSESYLWPFFGYVERTAPTRYSERHYFWPLLVQGRGDDRSVSRWAPFYTRSEVKGVEKTWVLWPVWRKQTWTDQGLHQTRRQFLYFLYRDAEQRSASNPAVPRAHKTHLWPLLSVWDNGAGRRQVQALSPLELFFPNNEAIRLNYSPLFAVYRYSRDTTGSSRHSLLWNFITFRRDKEAREFHAGPLISARSVGTTKRYAIGAGLLALEKNDGARWRLRLLDFKPKAADISHP